LSKSTYIVDTETNALVNYTKLHNVVFREVETDEVTVFRHLETDAGQKAAARQFVTSSVSTLVGHNILGFDCGVLRHFGIVDSFEGIELIDTLVLSRMLNYNQKGGHSLEEWGRYFGIPKSSFSDFSEWSQELEDRCILDTEINKKLYGHFEKYLNSPRYKAPIELELLTTALCISTGNNGMLFDKPKAIALRDTLSLSVNNLLISLTKDYPKVSREVRVISPCLTSKGTLHSKDFRWMTGEKDYRPYTVGSEFSLFEWVEFNPNSPRQRIERLNSAGWKPTEKTKGHIQALRDKTTTKEKLDHYKIYGWTCSEENLATLPPDAPESIRKLKDWLLMSSRLGDLTEWISACTGSVSDPRGYCRVHATLTNPGAWTMRVSHQKPNMANIPATLDRRGNPAFLGEECRSLWTVPEGYKLVGVDADSIQLRIFAHLCEDERLIASISRGVKSEKTDIHHLNLQVMHPICKTREVAKTYIYALLLGAGLGKQAEILGCTKHEASQALKRILDYYPGWKKLVNGRLSREGSNGYIEALDGRYLLIPEPRQALAAHLQSGEKIIMAKAAQNWTKWLEDYTEYYKLVNWVHDEWQTEVLDRTFEGMDPSDLPNYIANIQVEGLEEAGRQLNMNIVITGGKPKIGDNWAETH